MSSRAGHFSGRIQSPKLTIAPASSRNRSARSHHAAFLPVKDFLLIPSERPIGVKNIRRLARKPCPEGSQGKGQNARNIEARATQISTSLPHFRNLACGTTTAAPLLQPTALTAAASAASQSAIARCASEFLPSRISSVISKLEVDHRFRGAFERLLRSPHIRPARRPRPEFEPHSQLPPLRHPAAFQAPPVSPGPAPAIEQPLHPPPAPPPSVPGRP